MSRRRRYFFWVLAPILVAVTTYRSWYPDRSPERSVEAKPSLKMTLEEQVFQTKTKVILGALLYLEEHQSEIGPSALSASELRSPLVNSLFEPPSKSRELLFRELVVAQHLGESKRVEDLQRRLAELPKSEETQAFEDFLLTSYGLLEDSQVPELPDAVVDRELGWFATLFHLATAGDDSSRDTLSQQHKESVVGSFMKFTVVTFGVLFAAVVGFISLLVFAFIFLFRKTKSFFQRVAAVEDYCLEVFCFYFIGMLALPKLFELFVGNRESALVFNVFGILLMLGLLFWPMLFGVRFGDFRRAIGLETGGLGKFLADVTLSPFFYLGSLVVIFVVLIFYSLVIQSLGIDISQGAHPIVPILIGSNEQRRILSVVFLAVFVAPLVEEVMFRGVFYSWLRGRLGALSSIFVSALIFAIVHPQGPIGIVPLGGIGLVLGGLREWRGGLVAPMLTHAFFNAGTLAMVLIVFR